MAPNVSPLSPGETQGTLNTTCGSANSCLSSVMSGRLSFCFNSGCNGPTGWDEDLSAKGDIVRARLTIKTKGYGFFY